MERGARPIAGVHEIDELPADQILGRVPQQPPPRVVDSPNGAVRLADREQLLRLMEPVIALGLDRLPVGDVLGDCQEARDLPERVANDAS